MNICSCDLCKKDLKKEESYYYADLGIDLCNQCGADSLGSIQKEYYSIKEENDDIFKIKILEMIKKYKR